MQEQNVFINKDGQNQELQKGFRQLRKQKFVEANKLSSFDLYFTLIKFDMKGTDGEKDEQIRKRISKFFDYGEKSINLQQHEHFCEKRQPVYSRQDSQSIPNQLIIFGVDFLSKKNMRKRFSGLNPQVVTLDDSHYKIIFQKEQDAYKAIQMNIRDTTILKVKEEQQGTQYPRNWFELKPYYEMTFQRKLFCRYATNDEGQSNIVESQRHILFKNARKKFQQEIEPQVRELYTQQLRSFGNNDRRYGNSNRLQNSYRQRSRDKHGNNYNRNNSYRRQQEGSGNKSTRFGNNRNKQADKNDNHNLDEQSDDNYSFILSPKDLERQLMNMRLNEEVSDIPQQQNYDIEQKIEPSIDLSFEERSIDRRGRNNHSRSQIDDADLDNEDYHGLRQPPQVNTDFSYIDYIQEQERLEEEKSKKTKVKYVIIDDD